MFIAPVPPPGPAPGASPAPLPLDLAALVPAADWDRLPAALRRRFAVGHAPACYVGTIDLHRSRIGAAFAVLARLFGAPLPVRHETGVPAAVSVRANGEDVVWERRLGRQVVRSVKARGPGGTLLERTGGGLGMVLDVTAEGGTALVFTSRAFFLSVGRWRLPVPALLTPGRCRVAHRAIDSTRFRFTLTMTHPLWGTTFQQDGIFNDLPEDHQP